MIPDHIKKFDSLFGIESSLEEEKRKFVSRVNQTLFNSVQSGSDYEKLFRRICFIKGVEPKNYIERKWNGADIWNQVANLNLLTKNDFLETLKLIQIIYDYFKTNSDYKDKRTLELIDKFIPEIIELSIINIGIQWQQGRFLPVREKELDEKLVDETMQWLNDFPNEKRDFANSLDRLISRSNLGDVISNCYKVVEGLAREILNNDKTLDKNKELLMSKLALPQSWKSILNSYISYTHDFRHASDDRHTVSEIEAESFLYLTGVISRLIIKSCSPNT